MTTYFHVLCRRRPGATVKTYRHRLRRFIRKNHKKHQYTYQLYRGDTILRVTVICDPEEAYQALCDMASAMARSWVLLDWESFTSVLNEDPTEVPVEALDMAETEPTREPKPEPEPKPQKGAKSGCFFSCF